MLKQFLQSPFTRYCRSKVGWILGPAQQVQGSERVKLIKAWGRSRNLAIWRIGFLVTVAYGFQLLTVFKKSFILSFEGFLDPFLIGQSLIQNDVYISFPDTKRNPFLSSCWKTAEMGFLKFIHSENICLLPLYRIYVGLYQNKLLFIELVNYLRISMSYSRIDQSYQ